MSNITFEDGKYVGRIDGKVVVRSTSKYYVQKRVEGVPSTSFVAPVEATPVVEFPINQRFEFVFDLVTMVATGATASAIITGEGGLGKTHTVVQALQAAGLRDISEVPAGEVVPPKSTYRLVKGFSTAKGLYRILAENANSVIVFDDCDSVLKDDNALNILKGALDTYGKRFISWNSSRDDDDIPRFFQFKGGIVFISNKTLPSIDQAVRSRAMCVDLSMTLNQKIERMAMIMREDSFMPEASMECKQASLDLIDRLKEKSKEVSMRTLIKTTKIAMAGRPNWKSLAEYMLLQG